MNSTFKPALLLMAGRIVGFATTFFIPIVLVRVFDQTEFGTYKQIFLVYATVFGIAQIGMAESLYYFLPLEPAKAARYAANSLVVLIGAGLLWMTVLVWKSSTIADLVGNPALAHYMLYLGGYLFLTLASVILEIIMTARKRFFKTALAYAAFEVLRGAAFIIPALVFRSLEWLMIGGIVFAALRLFATVIYIFREFGHNFVFDTAMLKHQLLYALPLAASSLLSDWGYQIHQYAVSHYFDAATFAIYAVGCLNIPLVELVHNPVGNVMMVRMGEELRDGRTASVLETWNDTTRKLALVFFPMLGMLLVTARELIVLLFTTNYLASVPIFMIWSVTVLFPVLQTDGVLRVYAQTRFLLFVYGLKLAIIAALVYWFISWLGIWGAALVTIIASFTAKFVSLARFKQIADIPLGDLLPWKSLGLNALVSVSAGALTVLMKIHLEAPPVLVLFASGGIYAFAYILLAFASGLITHEEKQEFFGLLQQIPVRAMRVGHILKGS